MSDGMLEPEMVDRVVSALSDFDLWEPRPASALVGVSLVDLVRAVLAALVSQGLFHKETSGSKQRTDGTWGASVRYVGEWRPETAANLRPFGGGP